MTVKPKVLGKKARIARAKFPKKKIIIHFLQPHEPYIGYEPTREKPQWIKELKGEENNQRTHQRGLIESKTPVHSLINVAKNLIGSNKNPIEKFVKKYDKETLIKAYRGNLEIALQEIKKLIQRLPDDKIVVTADHGELLGENGRYRHPRGSNDPILRQVPWLEIKK